jgi:hypothetical protein
MSQGFLGYIGVAKETTWGTAVAATDYTELFSENVAETIDRFELKNAHGRFQEPDDAAGLVRVGGDIVVPGYPVILGQLLKGVMNSVSGSVVLSGSLWTSRFVSTKSEFSAAAPAQPYTLELFRDVGSSFQAVGACISRLQMACAPNQPLRLTASVLAKAATLIAKTTPTFVSSPANPFTFDTCSVQIGGAASALCEAFAVSIDNQFDGIPTLNNSTAIGQIKRRGFQMIRVSGTLDFPDVLEYLDFKNQAEQNFVFSFTKADSFQLVIDLPRVVYDAYPVGIPGKDRLTVQFSGIARFKTTSDTSADFRLTSTRSNY